uniref:Organic solute transporter subunit alpha-like n=1 Tax=Saccoglossus kowalevskii TaxID=10224 RepID=A0ABM0LXL6_SACKO|nr:PREDICTED: organic solute transporter subunit alpha-like [Saccoglossus kowalevskii]
MFNIGLMKSMVGDHLKDCKITPKFICIRLVLITTILQETLLSFLGTFGVIACRKSGPLANQSRTLWLNHNLLIFEMFFLLLWARHLYRTQEGNMYGIVPPSQIYRKIRQNERLNKRESLTADYRKANERTPLLSDIFEQA